MSEKKLFTEFPPLSTDEWEAIIHEDLKGADYSKKLIWRNIEGIDVKPYYRAEDLQSLSHLECMPGKAPYLRGTKTDTNDWLIRENICVKDAIDGNRLVAELSKRGVGSIGFELNANTSIDEDWMNQLLNDIPAEITEINFLAGERSMEVIEVLNENNIRIEGSVDYDPLSYFMQHGVWSRNEATAFSIGKEIIFASRDWPQFTSILVNGNLFRQSGASLVQELGMSLAAGAEYIFQIARQGVELSDVAENIRFQFAVGGNYFMEIAKFRAARYLWSKLQAAYGIDEKEQSPMLIHVETSTWNKSGYDAHTNMIRTTTEAMSAAIGGIHSMRVGTYNEALGSTDDFGKRIARNQQLLLKEESYFDRVIDPSAGSYYIEQLTHAMIDAAWKLFLEIEDEGGFLQSFKQGFIQNRIQQMAQKRDRQIAERKEILVGVNQYPNSGELLDKAPHSSTGNKALEDMPLLSPYRGAEAFELLRFAADRHSKVAQRPKAFMITMGNLAMRRARAQFASNFFACGGIEPIDNNGFPDISQAVKAFEKSQAQIAVLCSSDEEYEHLAPELKKQLPDYATLVIAGAPACMEQLQASGINDFIHMRMNVLQELKKFHEHLSITA